MLPLVALPFGAAIGSFLNVVAHRLPRNESLVRPPSHCPRCLTPIRPYDNVPVLSWLMLRGSCRSCGEAISARYPIVEAATAVLFAGCFIAFSTWWEIALGLALVTTLVTVTLTDLEFRIIPNKVLAASAAIGLAIVALGDPHSLDTRGLAIAIGAGPLITLAFVNPRGMGMGDGKLVAVMGLYLGRSLGPAVLIGFAIGAVVGAVLVARQGRAARKSAVPFGPFLAIGGVIALFAGEPMVEWYLENFMGHS